jgi:hypothetical protein
MSKVYCGADASLPKNSRYGTFNECRNKKQLRLYGRKLIPENELTLIEIQKNNKKYVVKENKLIRKLNRLALKIKSDAHDLEYVKPYIKQYHEIINKLDDMYEIGRAHV